MNWTWKNDKKTNLGPDFGSFDPNLCPKTILAAFASTGN